MLLVAATGCHSTQSGGRVASYPEQAAVILSEHVPMMIFTPRQYWANVKRARAIRAAQSTPDSETGTSY
jgi:hypothetical protein